MPKAQLDEGYASTYREKLKIIMAEPFKPLNRREPVKPDAYDRFSSWASIVVAILFGLCIIAMSIHQLLLKWGR